MSEYSRRILLGGVVAAVIGISLVVGIAYLPLVNTTTAGLSATSSPGATTKTAYTNVSTTTLTGYSTSAESTNSTIGLKLMLSLNYTEIQSGQSINVTASIFNTLPTVNNVSGANDWAIPSLSDTTSFPCPNYLYYQVYPGWYSTSNISESGTPLQVSPVYQFLSCPLFQRSYYLFHPLSDIASIPVGFFTINSSTVYQDTQMVSSGSLTGNYSRAYNASIFTPNGALPPPPFKPGIYTVVAGDEWGQMVILHFSVAVASAYTSTTITVTSASSISSTTLTFSSCSTVINVNGTEYCALDVSSDILLGNPGYSYFMTADAIVFNGVTFRTICPSGYQGCPNVSADKTDHPVDGRRHCGETKFSGRDK